jgi:hypothetical protein
VNISIEDYLEIQELYARYNQCADVGDSEGYAAAYTADGTFVRTNAAPGVGGQIEVTGSKNLEELNRTFYAEHTLHQHWNNNLTLKSDGTDRVIGRCYGMLVEVEKGGSLVVVCVYDDILVRQQDGWHFERRTVTLHN